MYLFVSLISTHSPMHARAHLRTYNCTDIHLCIHTDAHARTHTHTRTHSHTHTAHTHKRKGCLIYLFISDCLGGTYLGCYMDCQVGTFGSTCQHDLTAPAVVFGPFTIGACIAACRSLGKTFAGVKVS